MAERMVDRAVRRAYGHYIFLDRCMESVAQVGHEFCPNLEDSVIGELNPSFAPEVEKESGCYTATFAVWSHANLTPCPGC